MQKLIFYFVRVVAFLYRSFFDKTEKRGTFLSQKESLQVLIDSDKSLIRWGDGESIILTGGNLYFQENSFKLIKFFFEIVRGYNENSRYLIALPNEYLKNNKQYIEGVDGYRTWKYTRFVYSFFFKKEYTYLDAFMFRENTILENSEIEKLWLSKSNIFYIHNNFKYYHDFKNRYADKNIYFFQINNANAFAQSSKVLTAIQDILKANEIDKSDSVALISAGPASKVFVYSLSNIRIKSLDMGHYFDYKFYGIKRDNKKN